MTWIIATIVIVVVLLFFIFGASLFGSTKVISGYKNSLFSGAETLSSDSFVQKSVFSYLLTTKDTPRKKIQIYLDELGPEGLDKPANQTLIDIRKRYVAE